MTRHSVQAAFLNLQLFLAQLRIAVMSAQSGTQFKAKFGNLNDKESPLSMLHMMLQEFLQLLEECTGLCGVLQQRMVLLSGGYNLRESINKAKRELSQVRHSLLLAACLLFLHEGGCVQGWRPLA